MNFRTTLFLLILVVVVGGTIFFMRDRIEKPKVETTKEHKLVDVDSADVKRIAVTNSDDKHLVLEKSGSDWKLIEPIAVPAKSFEVDDLVRALTGLQSRGQVDASRKSTGGLDHPSFVVEITTKADKTTKLSFGENSQLGDSLYVQVNDNAKPDIVGNSIYATLDKPATNYRETKLVTAASSDIKQFSITSKGKTIKLEKNGENWKMTEPALPAETSAVSDLLFGITGLNATEFVDKPSAVTKNSLAHPRLSVWFSTKAPTTQPAAGDGETINFGGYQDVLRKNLFVSLNGKETAIVPASSEKTLDKTPLELRNKELLTINPDLVSKMTVSINRPATTQPTTKPAELREFTIERRKIAPPTLGPALPPAAPATQPSATTQPTTGPAIATTQPATAPVAATQPAAPLSKWFFASGDHGDAEEGQVSGLLDSFHPFKVEKYIEPEKLTGPTYTLKIHTVPSKADESADEFAFTFVDAGTRVLGTYKDVHFEIERGLLEKLTGDFKTKKAPPPPPPSMPRSQFPPGHPPIGE